MAEKQMNSVIKLRRDSERNFIQKGDIKLQAGEVAVVYTDFEGTRIKIGDGVHRFSELPYDTFGILVTGRINGDTEFISMTDNSYVIDPNKHVLFLDVNTGFLYYWDTTEQKYKYIVKNEIPDASETIKGIAKLYNDLGSLDEYRTTQDANWGKDGSVNRNALNEAFSKIQTSASNFVLSMDDEDEEMLNADAVSLTSLDIFNN